MITAADDRHRLMPDDSAARNALFILATAIVAYIWIGNEVRFLVDLFGGGYIVSVGVKAVTVVGLIFTFATAAEPVAAYARRFARWTVIAVIYAIVFILVSVGRNVVEAAGAITTFPTPPET